ncbi:hypothetical protein [Oculatella sp. FACHB-28]|nr:hypothetical protein [Oculatella sp. FACHB-28]
MRHDDPYKMSDRAGYRWATSKLRLHRGLGSTTASVTGGRSH